MTISTPRPPVTVRPTTYTVNCLPETARDSHAFEIAVEYRGQNLWAVTQHSQCLSADGNWHREPSSTDRDDDWLAAHRFPLPEALHRARNAAPDVTINGVTAADIAHRLPCTTLEEVDNQTRAEWAREVLQDYADRHYGLDGDRDFDLDHGFAAEQALRDLITNALHLLDELGFAQHDRQTTLRYAHGVYVEERDEEEASNDEDDAPDAHSAGPAPARLD